MNILDRGATLILLALFSLAVLVNGDAFAKSVNVSESEKSCYSGKLYDCYRLGEYFLKLDKSDDNLKKSERYLEYACRRDYIVACYLLGLLFSDEETKIFLDYPKANTLYNFACGKLWKEACTNLAVNYQFGQGTQVNLEAAKDLYVSACKLNDGVGCELLGNMYLSNATQQTDIDAARRYWRKACRLGSKNSCDLRKKILFFDKNASLKLNKIIAETAAECSRGSIKECISIAQDYDNGPALIKNREKAHAFWSKACNLGDGGSCYNVALNYKHGIGGPINELKVNPFFKQSCDKNYARGCLNIGSGLANDGKLSEALVFFRKGCKGGADDSCRLEKQVRKDLGLNVSSETPLLHDCKNKVADSCSKLAGNYILGEGVEKDFVKALPLAIEGCRLNDAWGCYLAASLYYQGKGAKRNKPNAEKLYRRSCSMGNGSACFYLGIFIAETKPGNNKKQISALWDKACALGYEDSCRN